MVPGAEDHDGGDRQVRDCPSTIGSPERFQLGGGLDATKHRSFAVSA
jgi:hypothetical protein